MFGAAQERLPDIVMQVDGAGWHRANGTLPTLRLANLVALRHPMSIDTYIDATLADAKGILIRLIGGESYWSYGLQQVRDLAQRRGIALAVLPGDAREDINLDAFSTLPVSTLRRLSALCDAGGVLAAQAALAQLAGAGHGSPAQGDSKRRAPAASVNGCRLGSPLGLLS